MRIRRAHIHTGDLENIIRWRREAAAWLAEHGSDQWSESGLDDTTFRERVTGSIQAGETWIAETDAETPVGTIALDQWSDDGLWNPDTLRNSLVIHRMMIDRSVVGQGVGQVMLEHADHIAADQGFTWLILDAWTTNQELHNYYKKMGFTHVGTAPGFASGALFQRRVSASKRTDSDSTRLGTSP